MNLNMFKRRRKGQDTAPTAAKAMIDAVDPLPVIHHVVLDAEGLPRAFYRSDMHDFIPEAAKQITEAQYIQWQEGHVAFPMKRHKLVSGELEIHAPPQTIMQKAIAAISSGLVINLGTTLEGVRFPTDATSIQKVSNILAVINATGKFPGSADGFPIKNYVGGWHTLTLPQYRAVASALLSFTAGCHLAIEGCAMGDGGDQGWPSDGNGLPASEVMIKA